MALSEIRRYKFENPPEVNYNFNDEELAKSKMKYIADDSSEGTYCYKPDGKTGVLIFSHQGLVSIVGQKNDLNQAKIDLEKLIGKLKKV